MTPERMRQIRETMHLSISGLGRWTGRDESFIRQMEAGKRHIPDDFAAWFEALGRWIEKYKPPQKTR